MATAKRGLFCLVFVFFVLVSEGKPEIGEFEKAVSYEVSNDLDSPLVITYKHRPGILPYIINVNSPSAQIKDPVIIVVRQHTRVTSWQVPLLVDTHNNEPIGYQNTSRILCLENQEAVTAYKKKYNIYSWDAALDREFSISLSTGSIKKVEVIITVTENKQFVIVGNKDYTTTFSPSKPVYFYYNFPTNMEKTITAVLVKVASESGTCFLVSVQPNECPVKDLGTYVSSKGRFQTVSSKGGLMIPRNLFPSGFHLVMVALADNYACREDQILVPLTRVSSISSQDTTTVVNFRIEAGLTYNEYVLATMALFGIFGGVCVFFIILSVVFYRFGRHRKVLLARTDEDEVADEPDRRTLVVEDLLIKKAHTVSDFVFYLQDDKRSAYNYALHVLNLVIFYGIPVIQLMSAYQKVVNISGNLDVCYYNFHCAHPFYSYLSDFNHIYSNFGYIILGLLFMGVTHVKSHYVRNLPGCGIPRFTGMYYAMGLALVFEGVLSACYHVCPNQSNFQFDTSFMYVIAILICIKLYQNRHPDINAKAYTTFSILGIAIILVVFGILYNSWISMSLFMILYITLCVFVGLKIYFIGHLKLGLQLTYAQLKGVSPRAIAFDDKEYLYRKGLLMLLCIQFTLNMVVVIVGATLYPNQVDFGTYLLGILMGNSLLMTLVYCIMKLMCRERICIESIMYLIMMFAFGLSGTYLFVDAATQWALTPAESKELNKDCMMFDFYDVHDVWHMLSAVALYCAFMFLQTIDDDLFDKPQTEIRAF